MDKIIQTMDSGLSKELTKVFKKQKLKIHTSHKVTSVERIADNIKVVAQNKNDESVEFNGDYCLVSIGRSAYTQGLNLDQLGIETNNRGQIEVNEHLQTKHSNIYAIGDVIDKDLRQIITAAADGSIAAIEVAKYLEKSNKLLFNFLGLLSLGE